MDELGRSVDEMCETRSNLHQMMRSEGWDSSPRDFRDEVESLHDELGKALESIASQVGTLTDKAERILKRAGTGGPSADSFAEEILSSALETVEMEYLSARKRGMLDPVLGLSALDPDEPGKVGIYAIEKQDEIESFRKTCQPAANALSRTLDPGRFYVVITTPRGVTVVDRPVPDAG